MSASTWADGATRPGERSRVATGPDADGEGVEGVVSDTDERAPDAPADVDVGRVSAPAGGRVGAASQAAANGPAARTHARAAARDDRNTRGGPGTRRSMGRSSRLRPDRCA